MEEENLLAELLLGLRPVLNRKVVSVAVLLQAAYGRGGGPLDTEVVSIRR